MNTDTGEIRYLKDGEEPKPNEVEIRKPNPNCTLCHGKGTYLTDISKDLNFGNRAERRRVRKNGMRYKYLPCPRCAEIKKL